MFAITTVLRRAPRLTSKQLHRRRSRASSVPLFIVGLATAVVSIGFLSVPLFPSVFADDDLLAEILAEEQRLDDEHSRLEEEAREFEKMKAGTHPSGSERGNQKMKPGKKGPRNAMPAGAGIDFSHLEEELRKKEAAAAARKAADEEKVAQEVAEQHRIERERQFEADLAKMNVEQQKAARRQKKIDARVVRDVLKASKGGKLYAVLGLRNWEMKVGPLKLLKVTTRDIKKAYRNRARAVHPDKNRDGRAEEAFDALEKSAAVLTDAELRADYDRRARVSRQKQRKKKVQFVMDSVGTGRRYVMMVVGVAQRVVGPFSTPILVLGALIV